MSNKVTPKAIIIDFIDWISKYKFMLGLNERIGNETIDSFIKEKKLGDLRIYIHVDDNEFVTCPKCDYERGRKYQWLGRWYIMCYNCGHGMTDGNPALMEDQPNE